MKAIVCGMLLLFLPVCSIAQQQKDFETVIAREQKTTGALVARLNEQEARIQRVSAQVEMRKSGSQMLVENQ